MSTIKIEPQHDSENSSEDDTGLDDLLTAWLQQKTAYRETEEYQNTSMEYSMSEADWFVARVRGSDTYAQNLYAAMCNNSFQKQEVWLVLKDQTWSCSWRSAGGIVADLQDQGGNYMDWYCSGIRGDLNREAQNQYENNQFVPEGTVTDEIREDLARLGWRVIEEPDSE